MKKSLIITALLLALSMMFTACGSFNGGDKNSSYEYYYPDKEDNYVSDKIEEKPFYNVSETPSSYFSLDRNTAAYSLVRRQINDGRRVNGESVRIEEMINYFDYGYPAPEAGDILKVTGYLSPCPWNEENKLLTVGVKTKEVKAENLKNNFVFLIDVSGSMYGEDRLELVKYGLNTLTDGLTENDRVSIVTYASGVELKLESTIADESGKTAIKDAVKKLTANGATSGSEGLRLAYQTAEAQKAADVNSRVIMMSDGDFNVGMVDKTELTEYIQEKAKSGVYLSVLGFGMGNTRDDLLEKLAVNGNGNYAYIDCKTEAEKVLKEELNGMLVTVAKNAKAGVTFTDAVEKYRLIGYDTKYMTSDDFDNPDKDAGEIGSNLSVTAMYEIKLSSSEKNLLATATVRYDGGETTEQIEKTAENGDNVRFAACVAEFGLLLRNSEYKGTASFENVLSALENLSGYIDGDIYKEEFVTIIQKAKALYN